MAEDETNSSIENKYRCAKCRRPLDSSEAQCDTCARAGVICDVRASDTLTVVTEDFAAKILGSKYKPGPGRKPRRSREYSNVAGMWNQDSGRPTRQIQDIDRINNRKVHIVRDAKTSKELLRKEEPLDGAIGRGSDKPALRDLRGAKRGRAPTDHLHAPLEKLEGYTWGTDGKPLEPDKLVSRPIEGSVVHPEEARRHGDKQLFIMTRTREIWEAQRRDDPKGDEYDQHERAMEQASRELAKRLKAGRALFERHRGAPQKPTSALVRDYQLVRQTLTGIGPLYQNVARILRSRKYKHLTVDALRGRIERAVKKATR